MMPGETESPKPQMNYRAARRAFIAACEAAGVDTVARLHPHPGATVDDDTVSDPGAHR